MNIININKYYKKIELIGKGSYSKVYKVKRLSDNKIFALKKVELEMINEKERENALNEVKILSLLKNSNIVGFIESFIEDKNNNLCIIMEYGKGGDLYETIKFLKINKKKLAEKTIKKYFYQLLKGLKSLSKNKIIHRDLKSANIFLFENMNKIKIGDFNVSKKVNLDFAQTQTGTPYYASPEVWRDENYTSKADIWSLGCIIYELCMLKPPFQGNNMNILYKNIQKGKITDWDNNYSKNLLNNIEKCFNLNPERRPSADDLLNEDYFKIFKYNKTKKKNIFIHKKSTWNNIKIKKNIKPIKSSKLDKKPNNYALNKKNISPSCLKNYTKTKLESKNKINLIINKIKFNFIKNSLNKKNYSNISKKNSFNSINYNNPKYCIYEKNKTSANNIKLKYNFSNILNKNISKIKKNVSKLSLLSNKYNL